MKATANPRAPGEPERSRTPAARIRRCNDAPSAADGAFILYWMISARRTRWNFGLQRAVELSLEHGLPLLVLEPLRAGYRWASDRFHRFIIDGMIDNEVRFEERRVAYYPYVEPRDGAGKGLLAELAKHAVVIVTDDFPAFFLPRMVNAAAHQIPVCVEAIDSNGLLPLHATDGAFATAYAFRRFLQRELPPHLERPPHPDPLSIVPMSIGAPPANGPRSAREQFPATATPEAGRSAIGQLGAHVRAASNSAVRNVADIVPSVILERWPPADLSDPVDLIARLPIDHSVPPVDLRGGSEAAAARLSVFLESALDRYASNANRPEHDATSRLSPYLHFGHIAAHEVFDRIAAHEGWTPAHLSDDAKGRRAGWWGMSESPEAFLDQLVTWRDLGFVRCLHVDHYDTYEALPDWARKTLADHAADPREFTYGLDDFEHGSTHDPLWNAAQNQLRSEGHIHNYLRMLWGKKILEWSKSPREALRIMIELNNKYALDGRDPNSWTGILWVLGLHDRAWGPERPVFGKIRYMSSANTARKYRVRGYIETYASP